MTGIDWDAYVRNELSPQEREALERRVAADVSLQKDLAGFVAFREAIREAGNRLEIPWDRLDRSIGAVVPKQQVRPRSWAVRFAPIVLLGLVLSIGRLVASFLPDQSGVDRLALAKSSPIEHQAVSSPAEGSRWLSKRMGVQVPTIALTGVATISSVQYGRDWGKMEYRAQNGHSASLFVSTRDDFGGPTETIEGCRFYKSNWGLGWRQDGLAYYLSGCGMHELEQLAVAAQRELAQKQ